MLTCSPTCSPTVEPRGALQRFPPRARSERCALRGLPLRRRAHFVTRSRERESTAGFCRTLVDRWYGALASRVIRLMRASGSAGERQHVRLSRRHRCTNSDQRYGTCVAVSSNLSPSFRTAGPRCTTLDCSSPALLDPANELVLHSGCAASPLRR